MAAQAQTRFTVRFGTPAAAVVAHYAPQYDGNGSVWISGYFDRGRWIPGYWAHRMHARYRNDRRYSDHAARYDNRYNRNRNYHQNDNSYRSDRGYYRNQRDAGHRGRHSRNDRGGWNRGRHDRGERH